VSRRAVLLLPYAVFLLLAAVSWNRWIEPYVDTGRELMVPWRVAQGETLYRDVRFYYGPLAPWLAAGVDLAAGRSLAARIALAALIALLHVEALRRLALKMLPAGHATVVTSLVVAVAFFLRPGGCHLFPYSLDTSIAVAAVTGALLLSSAGGAPGRDRGAAALLFAALLARPEIGLAGIGALTLERLLGGDAAARRRLPLLAALPIGLGAVVYAIASAGTPLTILKKEGWLTFLFLPPEFRSVYTSFAGVDRPGLRGAELALALIALGAIGLWLLLATLASARVRQGSPRSAAARAIEAGALAALAVVGFVSLQPPAAVRAVFGLLPPLVRAVPPLLFAAAAVGAALRLARRRGSPILGGIPDSVLIVALFFAARLFLAAGYVGPYNGFYLPLPLLVTAVLLLRGAERLPASWAPPPAPAVFGRLLAAAFAVFVAIRVGALYLHFRHPAWSRVSTPAGPLFVTEPVAGATRAALADLARRVPENGSMTGFPETGFFNWTLGRRNPLAQDQFFPGHLDSTAQEEVIARLAAAPPDAVVSVDVLTIGHGPAAFGRDYLQALDRFVRERFEPAASYGPGAGPEPRIGDPDFFVEIRIPRKPR
jgi:hypothetical protein